MSISSRRRTLITLCATAAVLAVAVAVNLVGVSILGNVDAWQVWLGQHKPHFFAWRLLLYSAIAYGWLRARRAVIERDADQDAIARLRRAEVAAALSIVLLELSAFHFVVG